MKLVVNSLGDLDRAAAELLSHLHGVVALHGAMGAGKTTLVAALMRAAGSADAVSSPTFALVNEYLTGAGETVYHFDFYRIESLAEALDIGCDEYFDSGALCLVEWPERIAPLLPADALHLVISAQPDGTRVVEVR